MKIFTLKDGWCIIYISGDLIFISKPACDGSIMLSFNIQLNEDYAIFRSFLGELKVIREKINGTVASESYEEYIAGYLDYNGYFSFLKFLEKHKEKSIEL